MNLPGIQNCIFWRRGESVREKSKGGRWKIEAGHAEETEKKQEGEGKS